MAYSSIDDRKKYQKCDNCIFIKACFWQEVQRMQEQSGQGNDCLLYQDERDLAPSLRTARYEAVKDFPVYDLRMRKPA
jgi:hypothetical protein